MNAATLLTALCSRYQTILGANFIGLYVHGSYAMGCFNPLKSDLDYIIVCEDVPGDSEKKAIMDTTIAFERMAPAKGLEMHVMLRRYCLEVCYPPLFELHYSGAHTQAYLTDPDRYIGYMHGEDPDLGAHLTVMYHRGVRIAGPDIPEVFGVVPKSHYINSVMEDLGWSEDDAMYHVLNHCRTLALAQDGVVLSKKEGALWALGRVNEQYHGVIHSALRCYESDESFLASEDARLFCEESLKTIKNLFGLS